MKGYYAKEGNNLHIVKDLQHINFNRKNWLLESFHSLGQHLCKFIGTKESIYIRKEFNSQRIGLEHQHGRRLIVFGTPIWPP